jgi:hypothetical protein
VAAGRHSSSSFQRGSFYSTTPKLRPSHQTRLGAGQVGVQAVQPFGLCGSWLSQAFPVRPPFTSRPGGFRRHHALAAGCLRHFVPPWSLFSRSRTLWRPIRFSAGVGLDAVFSIQYSRPPQGPGVLPRRTVLVRRTTRQPDLVHILSRHLAAPQAVRWSDRGIPGLAPARAGRWAGCLYHSHALYRSRMPRGSIPPVALTVCALWMLTGYTGALSQQPAPYNGRDTTRFSRMGYGRLSTPGALFQRRVPAWHR